MALLPVMSSRLSACNLHDITVASMMQAWVLLQRRIMVLKQGTALSYMSGSTTSRLHSNICSIYELAAHVYIHSTRYGAGKAVSMQSHAPT